MTTIRVAARKRFTQVDRILVNDVRLSFKARGILVWLLDKPDDWETTAERIEQQGTEGREAIRSALKELEAYGYLTRQSYQDAQKKWRSEWRVYEVPGGEPYTGSRSRKAVDGNPSLLLETGTDTEKARNIFSMGSVPPPRPGCALCVGGWVELEDGSARPCACEGLG